MPIFDLVIAVLMVFVQMTTAIFLVAIAFTDRMQRMPRGHLIGVELMCVGMLWSSVHSIFYLTTGERWAAGLPEMRYLTEIGLFAIAVRTMGFLAKKQLSLNDSKTPKPAAMTPEAKPKNSRSPKGDTHD